MVRAAAAVIAVVEILSVLYVRAIEEVEYLTNIKANGRRSDCLTQVTSLIYLELL